MENLLINKIQNDIECKICFEKFINLTNAQFDKFYKDNKEFLPETFEDDNCCRCYEDTCIFQTLFWILKKWTKINVQKKNFKKSL